MSLPGEFLSEEQFTCSICLEIFTNPVSTPCGHSFCLTCINYYWEGYGKSCFCPLCKENFRKRPELHVNHTLKEITEQFKRMAETTLTPKNPPGDLQANTPPSKPAGKSRPVELPGGLLSEMKSRFQKSGCPETSASEPTTAATLKRRVSTNGTNGMAADGSHCPRHWQSLDLFCKTDQRNICAVCAEQEHCGHTVVDAKREMTIKKSQLRIMEVEMQDLIKAREKKMEEIQTSLAEIEVNAERETAGTVGMFASLMAAVERSQAELLEVVQMGRRAAELRSQAFIRDLQGEISELKNRISIHNQMIQSQDHQAFFKTFPAYNSIPVMKSWTDVVLTPDPTAGAVLRNVTQLVEVCQERLKRLSEICLNTSAENPADNLQLRMWRIQECAMDITLDRDSAHPRLIISQDDKQVYCSDRYQNVPDTLERFDRVVCVLGRQGFNSGCHYWEILVGDKTDWDLGVAGHSISRKGKIAANPSNGYWFLSLRDKNDYVFRSEPTIPIYPNPKPQRIGVYVDYEKGQLAFYNADSKTQMFVFTHSFSDTLYPFFSPCTNKSGKNEAPLIICNTFPAD